MVTTTAVGGATHVECTKCGAPYESERLWRLSPCCEKPLYARYDVDALRDAFRPEALASREPTLWRYVDVLPVRDPAYRPSLGEGFTPLIDGHRLASELGVARIWLKDEGQNPTGSFKARGLVMAVARAWELGATALAIPSAGNAGSALAAYAAAAGLPAHIVMPRDTPRVIIEEARALGADVDLVDGLISDAAARVAEGASRHGWFDLSTLKEPYRVEGKKTMGYELHEQLGGRLPDVIVYPTGGGTGLVGMWKAFDEMQRLGWIDDARPRMISVQAAGCAPIVRAWAAGARAAEAWPNARTYAAGLRVPAAVGDFLILDAVRASGGAAIAVPDASMADAVRRVGRATGIFTSPEGGAAVAAVSELLRRGLVRKDEEIVVFLTGSGLKYVA